MRKESVAQQNPMITSASAANPAVHDTSRNTNWFFKLKFSLIQGTRTEKHKKAGISKEHKRAQKPVWRQHRQADRLSARKRQYIFIEKDKWFCSSNKTYCSRSSAIIFAVRNELFDWWSENVYPGWCTKRMYSRAYWKYA